MRTSLSTVVLGVLTGLINAQTIADLPSCSLSCLVSDIGATGCATTDLACICGKSAQLSASVLPCVNKACNAGDQAKTTTVLEGICADAGVPVNLGSPGAPSNAASATTSAVGQSSVVAISPSASGSGSSTTTTNAPASNSGTVVATSGATVPFIGGGLKVYAAPGISLAAVLGVAYFW